MAIEGGQEGHQRLPETENLTLLGMGCCFFAAPYGLINLRQIKMLAEPIIQEAVKRIVAAAHPSQIILFGSYARGDADEGSDLDLLVVEPEVKNPGEEMMRLHKLLWSLNIAVDVLVCSREEFEKKRNWCSTAIYQASREGRVLYGNV